MARSNRARSGDGSAINLFRRINSRLSNRRKTQMSLLAILTVLGAFAEFLSLGTLLPFLAVLVAPDEVFSYPVVSWLVDSLELRSNDQVVFLFALLFVATIVATAAIRLVIAYGNTRLAVAVGSEFTSGAFRQILNQPYQQFVHLDSSLMISHIDKTNAMATGFFQPLLQVISSGTVAVAILSGLLLVEPVLTALVATIIGGCYIGISRLTRAVIERNGRIMADSVNQRIEIIQTGFGGFRDIVLSGTQRVYSRTFHQTDWANRWAHGVNSIIGVTPRIVVEAVGAITLALIAYVFGRGEDGVATMLPVLGALAFGAQRLIPALQQIFYGWTMLVGGKARVADALSLLERLDDSALREKDRPSPAQLGLRHTISLEAVRFRYDTENPWVLDGVDLTVEKGECVGLVGTTGEGKTTLLDVAMGLLLPTEGNIRIDGHSLQCTTRRSWQNTIAHVPQQVFLANLSIAENIALGTSADDIDRELLDQVVAMSQLASTVDTSPQGYATTVGEQGALLSGGQQQRIGIARALYRQRSVLVLDEATSALDDRTEGLILQSLMDLGDTTILMVAHRASTLSSCDRLFLISGGSVRPIDSLDEVVSPDPLGSTAEPVD